MIDRIEELEDLVRRLGAAEWIAVDTEADSLHSYPEKLCLIQLSFEGGDKVVDPLGRAELGGLLKLLEGKHLILHGADYDLRLLHRGYGFAPGDFFDTMLAARLVGEQAFGLSDLTSKYLGVQLTKGPQKANWGKRPLKDSLLEYARNDTRYLRPLERALRAELERLGRMEWLREWCRRLAKQARREGDAAASEAWRLKGSDRLSRRGLAVLRGVWEWREEVAKERSRPPYFILSHEALVEIAEVSSGGGSWKKLLPARMRRERRDGIQQAIQRALESAEGDWPQPRRGERKSMTPSQRALCDKLRKRRDAVAADLRIDPTLIASKAGLIRMAVGKAQDGEDLMKWQRALLA